MLKRLRHAHLRRVLIIAVVEVAAVLRWSTVLMVMMVIGVVTVPVRRSVAVMWELRVVRGHVEILLTLLVRKFEARRGFVARLVAVVTDEEHLALRGSVLAGVGQLEARMGQCTSRSFGTKAAKVILTEHFPRVTVFTVRPVTAEATVVPGTIYNERSAREDAWHEPVDDKPRIFDSGSRCRKAHSLFRHWPYLEKK